jgi:hypothetical protein
MKYPLAWGWGTGTVAPGGDASDWKSRDEYA